MTIACVLRFEGWSFPLDNNTKSMLKWKHTENRLIDPISRSLWFPAIVLCFACLWSSLSFFLIKQTSQCEFCLSWKKLTGWVFHAKSVACHHCQSDSERNFWLVRSRAGVTRLTAKVKVRAIKCRIPAKKRRIFTEERGWVIRKEPFDAHWWVLIATSVWHPAVLWV